MADEVLTLRFGKRSFDDVGAGLQAFGDDLRDLWAGEYAQAKSAMLEYLKGVASILASRNGQAWPGGTGSDSLSRRTGSAVDSIIRSVKVAGTSWESLSGAIGGRDYLAIHEYGGTITARGGYLTIPLPAALGASGTSPPYARQWKNTFVARSRAGNLIIFQKRLDQVVPLYVLRPSVYIPPRLGMRRALDEQAPYFLTRAADAIVGDVNKNLEE